MKSHKTKQNTEKLINEASQPNQTKWFGYLKIWKMRKPKRRVRRRGYGCVGAIIEGGGWGGVVVVEMELCWSKTLIQLLSHSHDFKDAKEQ